MNVFYLSIDQEDCAKQHCDKHVVKMVTEYAQLLCTAHRVTDGNMVYDRSKSGRRIRRYPLSDGRDSILYRAGHINHPSAVWARSSRAAYSWLYGMFVALAKEYEYRYGKQHLSYTKLKDELANTPINIPERDFLEPPQAMPDYCKASTAIQGYRNYYIQEKSKFATWKKRNVPEWFACNRG